MLLTLGQVKTGPVGRSCGIATTDPNFAAIVNDATRQLMNRGSFFACVQPMYLPVVVSNQGHEELICPSGVESILAINNRHTPARVRDYWYRYVLWDDGFYHCFDGFEDSFIREGGRWRRRHAVAYGIGSVPCTWQINPANPMYVRATSSSANDSGINISIFGLDQNGQPVQAVLTLAIPPGQTYPMASSVSDGVQFSQIQRVVKDLSNGYVTLQQDDNNGNLIPISVYAPSEQTPDYTVMRLEGFHHQPMLAVIAVLSFIPALADTDNVMIENQDALRDMVLSIRRKEAGNTEGAAMLESAAVHELNLELDKHFPDEQFVVDYFKNSLPKRRRLF